MDCYSANEQLAFLSIHVSGNLTGIDQLIRFGSMQ
jgi:hypothetical protein